MRTQYLILIVLLIFLNSCKNKKLQTPSSFNSRYIPIKLSDTSEVKSSEIFKKHHLVKLSTGSDHLIGTIRELFTFGDTICIVNDGKSSSILFFNRNGEFIQKINRDEKNLDDYVSGVDYQIDTVAKVISILDRTQKSILNYTLTGKFIDKQELNLWGLAFYKDLNNVIIFCAHEKNENNGRLFFFASNPFKPLSYALPTNPKKSSIMTFIDRTNFTSLQDTLTFFESFNDTIYQIHDNTINIKYIIDFKENSLPPTFYHKEFSNVFDFYSSCTNSSYAYLKSTLFQTPLRLFLFFEFKGRVYQAIYNRENGDVKVINAIKQFAGFPFIDFLTNRKRMPINHNVVKKEMYYTLEPEEFRSIIEKIRTSMTELEWNNYCLNNPDYIEFYQITKTLDNPILIISTLNDE